MLTLVRVRSFLLLLLLVASAGSAAPATPSTVLELPTDLQPLPMVVTFATTHELPLDGFEDLAESREAKAGDKVIALVNLEKKGKATQWLIAVQIGVLTVEEMNAETPPPMTLFTSTGRHLEFSHSPVALELTTYGPFEAEAGRNKTSKVERKHARSLVNAQFLALGLDQVCRAGLRLAEVASKSERSEKSGLGFSSSAFSEKEIEVGRAWAETMGITETDERALASMMPALMAYFHVAQSAPGLQEILGEILNKPSLAWSFLRSGGKLEPYFNANTNNLTTLDPGAWQIPGKLVYGFPYVLSLNAKPTLNCALAVTEPKPPLLACAGIIGLTAEPVKPDGRRLAIRVLAARRASDSQP
jgi:hypothetical protein